jgi:REP element-mobilizing transposase RayT
VVLTERGLLIPSGQFQRVIQKIRDIMQLTTVATYLKLPPETLHMPVWNDTDVPLAYLITFRSYGTWLHGDERGSIDRFHNVYRSPLIPANSRWKKHNATSMNRPALILNAKQRKSVERAIRDTCIKRHWGLYAFNIRTNHVHSVVAIGEAKPEMALNALKANATRQMREDRCWASQQSPWADKGSKRRLWNERSVDRAINYVLYGQGDELPDFDE